MDEKRLEVYLDTLLEQDTLEDILERFNITPQEAFITLFNAGLIDEELIT